MGKLDGKVAIVTGAGRGLGSACARRLAGPGAKVAVTDANLKSHEEFEAERRDMTGESTVAEIEASGGSAIRTELDVADQEAIVARVVQAWGGITANCIAAGTIATARIVQTVTPGSSRANTDPAAGIAPRRVGTVEDCARVVEFLTTDLSDYVTGAVIAIDGGLLR